MVFLKGFILLSVAVLVSYITSASLGWFYAEFLRTATPFLELKEIVGFLYGYIFFLPLIYELLGDGGRYWWLGIFWFPVGLFVLYVGRYEVYAPLVLIISGFTLGYLLRKLKEFVLKKISVKKTAQ